jgi:hypothetical protein
VTAGSLKTDHPVRGNASPFEVFRNPQILLGNPRREIFEERMIGDQRVKALWKAGFEKEWDPQRGFFSLAGFSFYG